MKVCNLCHIEKPPEAFYTKKSAKDGLFWWCRDCHKKKMRDAYHRMAEDPEYREKEAARVREFYRENPDALRRYGRTYVEKNRAKVNAYSRGRYAKKLKRTPTWLSDDDFWMIEQAYELASLRTKLTGKSWHVDHIIPLQGELVSGLHVPHNLQVIPAWDNRSKSNKFAVTT